MMYFPKRKVLNLDYPFGDLDNFQQEINRLFDWNFPLLEPKDATLCKEAWAPEVDIYETKDKVRIKVDLPGLQKEDMNISVQDKTLIIRGEKKRNSQIKEEQYWRTERYYGSFNRTITLPSEIDSTKVQAIIKNGVLDLTLPKKINAEAKKINIDIK